MKIRNGFVSNSSSSSFICQCEFSLTEVKEKLETMLELYNKLQESNYKFDDLFREPFFCDKDYKEMLEEYSSYYVETNVNEGALIISSVSDNSIPYDLFDSIESVFKATRIHLG